LSDHIQQASTDQFVLVEDAAQSLRLDAKILRQGIACGLIPIRRDNIGHVRIHLGEVPYNLQDRIHADDIQPELHAAALADEVLSLQRSQKELASQRTRLEELIIKQGNAITRYSELLDKNMSNNDVLDNDNSVLSAAAPPANSPHAIDEQLKQRDADVEKLANILDRTFKAIDARDQQVALQTDQLSGTADKAIKLLERAVREGELSAEKLQVLNQQISASANSSDRLEQELDERNMVISNQNTLMERMVTLVEQTSSAPSTQQRRKRSFWQRLFGKGKGI